MNYKQLSLLVLTCALIFSCDKSEEEEVDSTAPVITLIGDPEVNVSLNGTYVEQGATASDDISGNLTDEISTEGTVNNNLAGEYEITYKVSDQSGNDSELTRLVTVQNDADFLKGMYSVSYSCVMSFGNPVNGSYESELSTSETVNNSFYLSRLNTSNTSHGEAFLNLIGTDIDLPVQTVGSQQTDGSGNVNADGFILSNDQNTGDCSQTFIRN